MDVDLDHKLLEILCSEQINKEEIEDLTQALFVLVADMFDNRNMQSDKSVNVNKMVDRILGMHSVNLL